MRLSFLSSTSPANKSRVQTSNLHTFHSPMAQSRDSNKYSIVSIVANSLTAGSLYTYPIYSSSLQSKLNFSAQQVSITASLGILTQYLCAAFWGSLADKHGPARLSLIASILFFLGYTPLSYSLLSPPSTIDRPSFDFGDLPSAKISTWIHVTLAYSLCGAATTASFVQPLFLPSFLEQQRSPSALTASTKKYGSSRPALSIAGPSTLFGLSPLILSFLGVKLFSNPTEEFNSSSYLGCLAILMTIVNLIGSIGLACKSPLKEHNSDCHTYEPDEQTPLLRSSSPLLQTSPPPIQSSPPLHPSSPPLLESLPNFSKSSRSLVTAKPGSDRNDHEGTRQFLRTPAVWLLGMIVLLSAGPAEMTISSIGLVVDNTEDESKHGSSGMNYKAGQVQLISLTNTLSRLLSGWTSDRFCGSGNGPRLTVWATGCLIYSSLCFSFAHHPRFVPLLSTITGCFYGMIFTLAPSLVATVWSISSFGRNYGIISYFSATGSFIFTFLFGILYNPTNSNSIRSIYRLSGFAELVSIFVIFFLYRKYWFH